MVLVLLCQPYNLLLKSSFLKCGVSFSPSPSPPLFLPLHKWCNMMQVKPFKYHFCTFYGPWTSTEADRAFWKCLRTGSEGVTNSCFYSSKVRVILSPTEQELTTLDHAPIWTGDSMVWEQNRVSLSLIFWKTWGRREMNYSLLVGPHSRHSFLSFLCDPKS